MRVIPVMFVRAYVYYSVGVCVFRESAVVIFNCKCAVICHTLYKTHSFSDT